MTRRDFLWCAAGAVMAAPGPSMGIASTSFVNAGAMDTLAFLEKCHALGAGGIQAQLRGDLPKLRARAEELGMWIEGMVSIPRNGIMTRLEQNLAEARTAGSGLCASPCWAAAATKASRPSKPGTTGCAPATPH